MLVVYNFGGIETFWDRKLCMETWKLWKLDIIQRSL